MPKSKGPHPLAICIHGGYWRAQYDLEYLGHLCAALTASGIATANVEYRRVGNVGGGWPGTFADIRSAYQWLMQKRQHYRFDAQSVIVLGHSAGAQLALCLAGHEVQLAGAISLAGVIDLQRAYALHLSNDAAANFLGGTPDAAADHYREADPMKLTIRTRQWIIHGIEDDTVPPDLSRDYVGAKLKAKENAQLTMIQDAGHFEVVDPRSAAWVAVEKIVVNSIAAKKA